MWRQTAWIAILISSSCFAGATLTQTRFSSCSHDTCVHIVAARAVQGSSTENSIYFIQPIFTITDAQGVQRKWRAESIFFDSPSDRLFISGLRHGQNQHGEAYFELHDGKLHILK